MVTNTSTLFSQDAVGMVHIKGYMYKWIMQDLGKSSVFSAVLAVQIHVSVHMTVVSIWHCAYVKYKHIVG